MKSVSRIGLLATLLGSLILGVSPVAATDSTYAGWMVSRDTSAFFIDSIALSDRWNSKGTSNRDDVQRLGTGHYLANFAGFYSTGGAPAVTAIGGSNWCTIWNWGFVGDREYLEIYCYGPDGQPTDSAFSVNYLYRLTSGGPSIAYAWNDTATTDHDLTGYRAYNSTGNAIHADRTSKGHWTITFVGLAHASGNVQVTTYQDSTVGTCTASKWAAVGADEPINVVCRDHLGAPSDMRYNLFFLDRVSLRGAASGAGAYFLASQPTATMYKPGAALRWSSSGKSPVVNRLSVGRYQVTLTGITGKGGSAQVTAVTATSNRCNIASLPATGTVQRVTVRCARLNGSPADTPFSFLFTR